MERSDFESLFNLKESPIFSSFLRGIDELTLCCGPNIGRDFRSLLYLSQEYLEYRDWNIETLPHLFVVNDNMRELDDANLISDGYWSGFLSTDTIFNDRQTIIRATAIEEVYLNSFSKDHTELEYDTSFTHSRLCDRLFYLELCIESNRLGKFKSHVLYSTFYLKDFFEKYFKNAHFDYLYLNLMVESIHYDSMQRYYTNFYSRNDKLSQLKIEIKQLAVKYLIGPRELKQVLSECTNYKFISRISPPSGHLYLYYLL